MEFNSFRKPRLVIKIHYPTIVNQFMLVKGDYLVESIEIYYIQNS